MIARGSGSLSPDMANRRVIILASLAALLAIAALAHLYTGDPKGGLHLPESREILDLRLPRIIIAAIVGGSLALAGVLLQALLRNPLASPDLLGVTSGAGLGVTVAAFAASLASEATAASPAVQTIAALLGAGMTLTVILLWTHRRGGIDVVGLVLVGVIVGMTCSGVTMLLHHLLPDRGVNARAWFFGSINEDLPNALLATCVLALGLCLVVSLASARAIDAACLGEDESRSVGVRLGRLRIVLFAASGVLATSAVVLAGPIGFVGLIVPHAVRMVLGPPPRPLLSGATRAGAAPVIAADAAVSAFPLDRGGRLPIGVVMAIIGGPLFLILLRSTLRRASL
jgi:iron complex transport system permease protein